MSSDNSLKISICLSTNCKEKRKNFVYSKKIEVKDSNVINQVLGGNLQIGSTIEPQLLGLSEEYQYKITGASGISGTPYKKFVNCYNPVHIKVRNRKKQMRVLSKYINYNCSVLNLKAIEITKSTE